MPVKRRIDKRRAVYPAAIVRLLDGLPDEYSDEADKAVFDLYFFGIYPELDGDIELHARAAALIDAWTGWR